MSRKINFKPTLVDKIYAYLYMSVYICIFDNCEFAMPLENGFKDPKKNTHFRVFSFLINNK